MTTKELLIAARARIAKPEHWTTGTPARNARGEPIGTRDPSATRWCAWAAIVTSSDDPWVIWQAEIALMRGRKDETIYAYNDRVTHRSILRLFTRAIKAQSDRDGTGVSNR